jgi:Fe-S cluster biogenesis protein NfuA
VEQHGGGLELTRLDEGIARIRLVAGAGCGSTGEALRRTVEEAVEEAAPELMGIEVEEVARPAPPAPLIQVQVRPKAAATATGR